ncbi:hypothetical protein FOZ62_024438 [Perkinsus olseni]|uniref:Uncharacterized protein n=1 Tax=Perkinsus olseni TaxID=32597 RepID=A0A7J6TQL5_PEROL|nr:hypothetical protein FOZ62_024438 [Perkinsus olseni]
MRPLSYYADDAFRPSLRRSTACPANPGQYAILNVGFERVLAELLQLKRLLLCRGTLLGVEVGILPSFVSWMRRLGSQIDMGQITQRWNQVVFELALVLIVQ